MGLREQEQFLAKLYTDGEFQAARVFGLSDEEISQMRALCPAQVRFFASTLELRRAAQTANLIPALSAALGRRYLRYFHDYVVWRGRCTCACLSRFATFYRRRREDGLCFAALIAKQAKELNLPPWIAELARYERIRLTRDSRCLWATLSRFRYPVNTLAEAFEYRKEVPELRQRQRLLFAIKLGRWWEATFWLALPSLDRAPAEEAPKAPGSFSRVESR
jgi:hypothetical protein